jgi:hypothetical protein
VLKVCKDYGFNRIDILKLDIEGAEHKLLSYLQSTGRLQLIHKIWVEYHYEMQNIPKLLLLDFGAVSVEEKGSGLGLIKAER